MTLVPAIIFGVLFRLWFISLVPQPQFVFDQNQYLGYALGIIEKWFHADSYRLYGYPLFLVPFIWAFGRDATFPWQITQAILDTSTGLLVFFIAKKLFDDKRAAWLSFLLYLVNPFTSAYVGVMLSEILAIFLLTLIFYLLLRPNAAIFLALVLGYLPQVRPSFFIFSLVVFLINRRKLSLLIFLIPFLYTIAGNIYHYRQFALFGVDNSFVRELYTSQFVKRVLPIEESISWELPPQVYAVWSEYSTPSSPQGRALMAKKYWDLSLEIIKRDPGKFIRWRVEKMWYIWEKHYLFPYAVEQRNPLVYWGNILLLGLGILGFIWWLRAHWHERKFRHFSLLFLFLVTSTSLVHTVSTAEERFTLPVYPLIILFAGYCLYKGFGRSTTRSLL